MESDLVDKKAVEDIRSKQKQQYSDEDFERLESLMYDRYHIKLDSAQLLMADTLDDCMGALSAESSPQIHVLERINLAFKAETCIVPTAPNLTRFRILGDLPDLHVHFSDRKYKNLMRMIDIALPKLDSASNAKAAAEAKIKSSDVKSTVGGATFRTAPLYLDHDDAISLGEETDVEFEDEEQPAGKKESLSRSKSLDLKEEGDDKFYDADDIEEGVCDIYCILQQR